MSTTKKPVARRAEHNQRRDTPTTAIETLLQRNLRVTRHLKEDLDLAIRINDNAKIYIRLIEAREGLLIGCVLLNPQYSDIRTVGGDLVIRVSAILTYERLPA